MANASAIVKNATSSKLTDPDWALNIELCDVLNTEPWQRMNAMKIIKEKLFNRNHKKQLLALFVLETLSKNCGEYIFLDIIEADILKEMVKIAKKKSELSVREKILSMIDVWQEALGGALGSFHLYYDAYMELKSFGLEFPPREKNSVPFATPEVNPLVVSSSEEISVHASPTWDSSGLSMAEIENAAGVANILSEMLEALDIKGPQNVKDEVITDLVDECRIYQKRVGHLVNNTIDEALLFKGLELNDSLQQVLIKHNDIMNGKPTALVANVEIPAPSLGIVDQEDEDLDEQNHDHLINRYSLQEPAANRTESNSADSGSVDDLSDNASFESASNSTHSPVLSPKFWDELHPPSKSCDECASVGKESMYKQRVSYLDQASNFDKCGTSETEKVPELISIEVSSVDDEEQREEALFNELVEFAKARAALPKPKRSFQEKYN